ncbi:VOC family protein [Acidisphaera rubrifaciens]|uniref:Glyoxalase/bleomycin resistance protein/dioxygenase n=1 Tax=Acidisphaera rubrifaciens HS-AP3 TaxID=1231350 RepID=A0A0D6P502_9PROT|nr:VOC family protein [Acidisphaera rubrifaciens]GAN76727.1 glyoxalase/bleomycin resistance protein/dioxygenase [Acidisphaera rubrifaciens HS-AP3]
MSASQGRFVWCELCTTDAPAASAYYTAVVGWTAEDSGFADRSYTILRAGEGRIGGIFPWPQAALDAGARPQWLGYIWSDDVDADAARVTAAGGTVSHPPSDIPGVGRFAHVTDPQGAPFVLFRGLPPDDMPTPPAPDAAGHVGWHELCAAEHEAALAFYAALFGWTRGQPIDMNGMGTYQLFDHGGRAIGGMMTRFDAAMRPAWRHYFNVPDIDAASARATAQGGQVVRGPDQVPGGSWIIHAFDPQGAAFALVGARPGAIA